MDRTIDEILQAEFERCQKEADERAKARGPDPYALAYEKHKPKRRRPDFHPYLRLVKR